MRSITQLFFVFFTLILLASCDLSSFNGGNTIGGHNISIRWTPPVERENGDKLLAYEIGGYEISFRKQGTIAYSSVVVDKPGIQEFSFPIESAGTYEVRIAAFDTNGLYSQFSDPAFLTAP